MSLQKAIKNVFVQLAASLEQLSDSQYARPCVNLSNNSVGQHVRHIIEMFQGLEKGYAKGTVDYEDRARDKRIETQKQTALLLLQEISAALDRPNKPIVLIAGFDDVTEEREKIDSNYYREVAYNLEHCIHHMALIRIGIRELGDLPLDESYGVASSTVKYNRECAQ